VNESQLFISRIDDLILKSDYNQHSFLGFLNATERSIACSYLKNKNIDFKVFGGYNNAERVYLTLDTDIDNNLFPVKALLISSRGNKELIHRDYLGSLIGLGIKRECIGDIILLSAKEAVVFLRNDIVPFVMDELRKVGNNSVYVSFYEGDTASLGAKTEEIRIIVSSMRVDNIVSSLAKCSRSQASDLISGDKVFVNYYLVLKSSQFLSEGDVISIRGFGKFIIGKLVGNTKRDKLVISVTRYV